MPTIQDTLTADKAALALALTQVQTLQAKIDAETATIKAVQPHLDLLSHIESDLAMIEATVEPPVAAQIDPIRLSILDKVEQIRVLILNQ